MAAPGWSVMARISLAGLAVFCLAMLGAMWRYAGGSWLHPHAPSHVFFENFWCDLLREPAHNGCPNGRSVRLAMLGFAALGVALAAFWLEVSHLLPRLRGRFVRVAGVISALATALVALLPSDRFPALHAPAVLTAGGLGFVCGCICSAWAVSERRRAPAFALSSLLLVAAAAVNLVLYVRTAYFAASDTIVLPAVQKVATLALLFWLVQGLRAARLALSPGPSESPAARR